MARTGRNTPCPCGSGKKYKHCCFVAISSRGLPKRTLHAEPGNHEELNALGMIAYQTGRHDAAISFITRAVRADPSNPGYHTNLGMAFMASGRIGKAVASWRDALAIEPEFPEANVNLGTILCERGSLDEGIALLRKAVRAKPDFAEAHNNLGTALLTKGQWGEAERCLRTALAIKPDYALAQMNMGNALRQQGRTNDAIACYREAVSLDPTYAPGHYNLGKAWSDFGQLENAVESYRRALELDPDFADAHNSVGIALWELGRVSEAIESIQAALKLRPNFVKAHLNLHSFLLDRHDLQPSIACLKKALQLTPDDAEAHFYLGMLLDYGGEIEAAAPHLELASKGPSWVRASLDSYLYIKAASAKSPALIGSPLQAFQLGLQAARSDGLVLEFGVRFGTSIRQIAALVETNVHGFDSFEGLPEAWHDEPRGSYSTMGALPEVPDNVALHKGWFSETLPQFLQRHDGPVRFMNVDCDIYSSTHTLLELLADRIVPGTVIVFDEYLGHEHWREDEFRAFQEAVLKYGWTYEYICFSVNTGQAVVLIKSP